MRWRCQFDLESEFQSDARSDSSDIGDRSADDGVGANGADAGVHGYSGKRWREQGRELGAVGRGMHRGSVWDAFGGEQRFWSCGDLYGACECAEPGGSYADGDLGCGHHEGGDRDGDDYRGTRCGSTGERDTDAEARWVGARTKFEFHRDGDK